MVGYIIVRRLTWAFNIQMHLSWKLRPGCRNLRTLFSIVKCFLQTFNKLFYYQSKCTLYPFVLHYKYCKIMYLSLPEDYIFICMFLLPLSFSILIASVLFLFKDLLQNLWFQFSRKSSKRWWLRDVMLSLIGLIKCNCLIPGRQLCQSNAMWIPAQQKVTCFISHIALISPSRASSHARDTLTLSPLHGH